MSHAAHSPGFVAVNPQIAASSFFKGHQTEVHGRRNVSMWEPRTQHSLQFLSPGNHPLCDLLVLFVVLRVNPSRINGHPFSLLWNSVHSFY
jgi:hypothetical protein